jgi:hypothetical protein
MSDERKHGKLYDAVYKYGWDNGYTFEETVALLLEVCDEEHLRKACDVPAKKSVSLPPVKDPVTGKWRIPTPIDELGITFKTP